MQNMKTRQFEKLLVLNGFLLQRQKGSHATYKNEQGCIITIPIHNEINACIVSRLIKQYGLS